MTAADAFDRSIGWLVGRLIDPAGLSLGSGEGEGEPQHPLCACSAGRID